MELVAAAAYAHTRDSAHFPRAQLVHAMSAMTPRRYNIAPRNVVG